MKKHLFALLVLLYSFKISMAQNIQVIDKSTLQPLEQVTVTNEKNNFSATTNNKGTVDVTCCANNDTLTFRALGYATLNISVNDLEKTKFKVYLSSQIFSVDEVVISSSRFEEKKRDVPQQIEVIKKRDIEFANTQTTADLLANTGNVFVQKSQGGGGSPVLRGFEASRVLIVVDGMRMNNAIYRAGHLQNILRVDQNMLEKAEVIFGPGSVIYGSDALGGVMHLQTRNPRLSNDGKLFVQSNIFSRYASANNEKTGHADINFGLKKVGFLTSFNYSDFDDLRQGNVRNPLLGNQWDRNFYAERINGKDSTIVNHNPNIQKQSGYFQYDIMQKILIKPSERWKHVFNFQFSNTGYINRYDRLSEMANGNLRFAEWYYGPEKRLMASYMLEWKGNNKAFDLVRIVPAVQKIQESRYSRSFGRKNLRSQIEDVMLYSLNADFSKKAGKHEIRYGIEGAFNDVNSTATFTDVTTDSVFAANTRYPDGGNKYFNVAAFITNNWEINEKLILSAGLRFSYVGLRSEFIDTSFYKFKAGEVSQNNAAPSGSLGLVYSPGMDWRLALSASTGFRSPNVDDLGKVFDSAPGILIVPNTNIKPEYTYNVDLNISKVFWNRLYVEAVGWFTYYQNALAVRPFQINGQDSLEYDGRLSQVVANQNMNKATLGGTSFNVRFDANDYISFSQSFNYTFGRIIDTVYVPLDHIPPAFGRTSITFTAKRLRSEFFAMYNGWKKLKHYSASGEDNLQYATANGMPSWFTLNFRASVQIIKQVQLQAGIENILDHRYRTFASGISGAGRNVFVTLRLSI
jgi:hemoglobin/transferrin/lactoferrin receptor protein